MTSFFSMVGPSITGSSPIIFGSRPLDGNSGSMGLNRYVGEDYFASTSEYWGDELFNLELDIALAPIDAPAPSNFPGSADIDSVQSSYFKTGYGLNDLGLTFSIEDPLYRVETGSTGAASVLSVEVQMKLAAVPVYEYGATILVTYGSISDTWASAVASINIDPDADPTDLLSYSPISPGVIYSNLISDLYGGIDPVGVITFSEVVNIFNDMATKASVFINGSTYDSIYYANAELELAREGYRNFTRSNLQFELNASQFERVDAALEKAFSDFESVIDDYFSPRYWLLTEGSLIEVGNDVTGSEIMEDEVYFFDDPWDAYLTLVLPVVPGAITDFSIKGLMQTTNLLHVVGPVVDIKNYDLDIGILAHTSSMGPIDVHALPGETILGTDLAENLEGINAKDDISGSGGNDVIHGYFGDDFLSGGEGDDVLYGGGDDDTLIGGDGNDVVFGGAGIDTFVLDVNSDNITFEIVSNRIEVTNLLSTDIIHNDIEFLEFTNETLAYSKILSTQLNARPTGEVSVLGSLVLGSTLSADITLSDADGLGDFTYQWLRDGSDIAGATAADYVLVQDDVTFEISLRVSYIDGDGMNETVTSTVTDPVESVTNFIAVLEYPFFTTAPWLASDGPSFGNAKVGDLISLTDSSAFTDGNGIEIGSESYQWFRNGEAITGTTTSSYVITLADVDSSLTGQLQFTDGAGNIETYMSEEISSIVHDFDFGTAEVDVFLGTEQTDIYDGLAGADIIIGRGGADVLLGGVGNDHVYGNDFELRYALTEANQVFRLYQATFNRAPDETGQKRWTSDLFTENSSLADVRQGFVGSQEFRNKYDAVDDATFVKKMYINVLDRDFDLGEVTQTEVDNWTNRISDTFTRADVVNGFAESQQLINNTNQAANKLAVNNNPSAWSDDVFRLYQATLNRAPDASGFANWSDRLTDGRSLTDVISGFTNSQEFSNTYGGLNDPGDFVKLLYNNVLGRDFDIGDVAQSEVDGWTSQLSETFTRAHIVQGFSQSSEFTNNSAQDLKDWVRAQGVDDVIDGGAGVNKIAGGSLADTFVFDQLDGATITVLDLEAWDYVSFDGFGYSTEAEARSHMTQNGGHVFFVDQGTEITFERFTLDAVVDDMILI
ncbi:MAG: DUF4214 domain-containing protein [Sulfitobacter sp.]